MLVRRRRNRSGDFAKYCLLVLFPARTRPRSRIFRINLTKIFYQLSILKSKHLTESNISHVLYYYNPASTCMHAPAFNPAKRIICIYTYTGSITIAQAALSEGLRNIGNRLPSMFYTQCMHTLQHIGYHIREHGPLPRNWTLPEEQGARHLKRLCKDEQRNGKHDTRPCMASHKIYHVRMHGCSP